MYATGRFIRYDRRVVTDDPDRQNRYITGLFSDPSWPVFVGDPDWPDI